MTAPVKMFKLSLSSSGEDEIDDDEEEREEEHVDEDWVEHRGAKKPDLVVSGSKDLLRMPSMTLSRSHRGPAIE